MTSEELRPLMLSIAYRMVGSYSEAEDLVQESFLRLHEAGDVESPKAWLTTVTTRLAIDHLRSARVRREQYPGNWLPEPVVARPGARGRRQGRVALARRARPAGEPDARSSARSSCCARRSTTATTRSRRSSARARPNCRQLAARARRHVDERRSRFEPSREQRDELVRRFVAALQEGDTGALVELLAADVEFYGDGGGKARAAGHVVGADAVVRMLAAFMRIAARSGATAEVAEFNGESGLAGYEGGALVAVWAFEISDGAVQAIRGVVNPDKLRHAAG